jgi:membrane protease YdiL (CAAX protease family)
MNCSKSRLWLELILLFFALPLVCWLADLPVILALLVACAFIAAVLVRDATFDRSCFKNFPAGGKIWRQIFLVWLCAVPLLAALAWLIQPESLFDFPVHRTKLWLLVMVAYPVISVAPQEIIYRAFFCHRYAALFGSGTQMVCASAAVFSWAHIVFGNVIAVALTLAGGWLFARAFLQTNSIPCVAIQHALYGAAIFTIGLGKYFFHGSTQFMEMLANHFGH